WEPLLAIAALAGPDRLTRARDAALELHGGEPDAETEGVLLLSAIAEVFTEKGSDRILTAELLNALVERETEPWGEWWGKPVASGDTKGPGAKLARLLKPFGIIPKPMRVGEERGRGYDRSDFADAFARYLPAAGADTLPMGSKDVTTG